MGGDRCDVWFFIDRRGEDIPFEQREFFLCYTVDGDQFSVTDTYNGLVWGYRHIADEKEAQPEETGPAETP